MNEYLPEGRLLDTASNRSWLSSADKIAEAMRRGVILEGRAAYCDCAHDLCVDMGCMRGVIPREEGAVGVREGTVRDIAILSRVGHPVSFVVTDMPSAGGAVLSRAQAQRMCLRDHISGKTPGDVIPARITHLEPFGAFCDIGCGLIALMPIDSISVSRIEHPDERFSVGMDIFAVIKSKVGSRITLSHKELLGTWRQNADLFTAGQTVTGIVRSVENYGAFVELRPNLAGLAEPREGLRPGQRVSVYIKSVIPQKMKVKLIVIDALDDELAPEPPEYYITSGHIDRFEYSPEGCSKYICSEFT